MTSVDRDASTIPGRPRCNGADREPSSASAASLGDAAAIARLERELFATDAQAVRIGRYEVLARVGAGGFGTVYRARDPELDRIVALKLLHPSRMHEQARRMIAEARAMAAVEHPNVAKVFDVGVIEGAEERAYVAMEWLDGPTLREWLAGGPARTEILHVLVGVGHGLAAAHARGLVHGDVKPDNVVVCTSQRGPSSAKVVDFGLARPLPDDASAMSDETGVTHPELTPSRQLAGTPAYLAPERRHGATADPRADQFAFFVMVYEALHGRRPFAGTTVAAVAAAIDSGRADPVRHDLPRGLRRAIERGLARDPRDRHADMRAALRAMMPAPARRRLAIVSVVGVGAIATAFVATRPKAAECPDADAELRGVWDEDRRDAVRSAFLATNRTYAARAWTRTESRLTRWVDRWRGALAQTCAEDPSSATSLRRECLDDRRAALGRLVDVLASADTAIVERGEILVDALPEPGDCDRADATTVSPMPSAARNDAAALATEANARYALGDYASAGALAAAAATASATAGDPTLEASALRITGKLEVAAGRLDDAVRTCERALELVRTAGDDRTTAELALDLAHMQGVTAGRASEGVEWLRQADAAIARVDGPERLRARRASVEAALRVAAGDAAGALALAREAVDILSAYDGDDPHLLEYAANLGVAEHLAGDPFAARRMLVSTLARLDARVGPAHPAAITLAGNLALPLLETGRFAEAETVLARALAATDARPYEIVLNLAIVQQLRGRTDAARSHYDEALAIAERDAAVAPMLPAQVLLNTADFAARTGDLERARSAVARARVIIESLLPAEHPVVAILLATDCLVRTRAGEHAAAIELGERARTIAEASGDPRLLASVLLELGEAELAAGRPSAAATLTRADAIAWPHHDPLLAARVRFALARASSGDQARAFAIAAHKRFPRDGDELERRAIATLALAPR